MTSMNNICENVKRILTTKHCHYWKQQQYQWYDNITYKADTMMSAHRIVWATVRTAVMHLMVKCGQEFDHAHIVVELRYAHMKLLSTQACVTQPWSRKCESISESKHVHQATHAYSGGRSQGANRPTSSTWALIAAPLESSKSTMSTWPCRAALIRQE